MSVGAVQNLTKIFQLLFEISQFKCSQPRHFEGREIHESKFPSTLTGHSFISIAVRDIKFAGFVELLM